MPSARSVSTISRFCSATTYRTPRSRKVRGDVAADAAVAHDHHVAGQVLLVGAIGQHGQRIVAALQPLREAGAFDRTQRLHRLDRGEDQRS
jgi:hypothetical protein